MRRRISKRYTFILDELQSVGELCTALCPVQVKTAFCEIVKLTSVSLLRSKLLPNEIFEIFHYLLSTTYLVLGTSSRYTTKKTLILLQIQPKPHFKIHKDVIRLLIVSRPPSDNFNDRDTSFRTSRKTENTKYGLFYTFYRLSSTKRRQ